jgi:hypothetical protein
VVSVRMPRQDDHHKGTGAAVGDFWLMESHGQSPWTNPLGGESIPRFLDI